MPSKDRLRIAIQKNGRLHENSRNLLSCCGIQINTLPNILIYHDQRFSIDVLLIRDDDIPELVRMGACDLGILGENVLLENNAGNDKNLLDRTCVIVKKLGFCSCRLSIAVPKESKVNDINSLQGLRIATSHPYLLKKELDKYQVEAEIIKLSGALEIIPSLGIAEAIFDIVCTGYTLEAHNLKEILKTTECEAVMVKTHKELSGNKQAILSSLMQSIDNTMFIKQHNLSGVNSTVMQYG